MVRYMRLPFDSQLCFFFVPLSRVIPGTLFYGKRDPYYSHITFGILDWEWD